MLLAGRGRYPLPQAYRWRRIVMKGEKRKGAKVFHHSFEGGMEVRGGGGRRWSKQGLSTFHPVP